MHSDNGVHTDIPGVTEGTYRIPISDVGKYLKDRVSFTDDAGNQESLTSAAVGPIIFPLRPPSNVKAVPGDGKVGISWDAPENERPNFKALDYEVRWRPADSIGAFSSSGELSTLRYIITGLTNGEQISVQVRARYAGALSSYATASVLATPEAGRSPQVESADVADTSLVLRYDSTIYDTSVPSSGAFEVLEDSTEVIVSSVEINGRSVWLTLASSVAQSATVTVSYDAPTGSSASAIKDWVGNAAASFSEYSVTNASALSSDASLSSLAIDGVSISPTFSASSYTYTASVEADVSSITIDAEATDSDATLSVSPSVDVDPSVDGQQVNLDAGENVIAFTVTAENGVDESTYTVTVTRAEGPPGAPRSAKLVTYDDEELTIEWKAPLYDGGSDIIGFKVQWKSGTQDWDSSRQYDLKERFLDPNIFGIYSRRIASLTNGVEYTVRILAYNEHGDGVASDEITGTPTSLQAQLIDYIDEEVIGEYGDDHAWLSQAWNHMTSNNVVFDLVSVLGHTGLVDASCPAESDGLAKCIVAGGAIGPEVFVNAARNTLDRLIIHELAHPLLRLYAHLVGQD